MAINNINTNSYVSEDWQGGYKLELDLTSQSQIDNWTLDFELPYQISAAYGVDLVQNSNGSYTIEGKDGWENLNEGQYIQPVFIVEDNGGQALPLEFIAPSFYGNDEYSSQEPSASEDSQTELDVEENTTAADENSYGNDEYSSQESSTNQDFDRTEDIYVEEDTTVVDEKPVAQLPNDANIISVDNDFDGDLERAIAAANDGEVVQLGNRTYYTSGITIEKDITLDGRANSIIDGGGTSGTILSLTQQASGATIQNIEITNGNNGIYSYGASNLTLQNLEIHNIGNNRRIADGQNNTGITLDRAEGLQLLDSKVYNVSRKGVGIGDTDGALISNLTVQEINLEAQHAQSHDAAGIKFFNTNDVLIKDSYFSDINANHIWNDTTNRTTIENNVIERVGEDFIEPSFNDNVDISGIYNEKSSNSVVRNNYGTAIDEFTALNATEFTTETMVMENNDFSSFELNTRDYWVNEAAEKLIATTEDPAAADFSLFADEYAAQADIN